MRPLAALAAALALAGAARAETVVVPGAGPGPHPGVLFVHWLGEPATTNHTEFERDARALAEAGVTSVLVDAMWARPDWFDSVGKDAAADVAAGRAQVAELKAALDRLEAQPGVDRRRIALVGHDFGAMFGVLMAAEDRRPRWYVLMAGVPTMAEWYLLGKAAPTADYADKLSALDPAPALARARPDAVLFQFAARDRYVPAGRARLFSDPVTAGKTVRTYDAGHDLAVEPAFEDRVAWLKARLGGR